MNTKLIPVLSDQQRAEYQKLKIEIVDLIHAGLQAFETAGMKLLQIREGRLYQEEYATFEEFCREMLGHSKTYANNLIAGFNLLNDLSAQGIAVLPDCERVARELGKYPRDMRAMIWKRALKISGKRQPDRKTLREASLDIVPIKKVQDIWASDLMKRLRAAKKSLSVSVDFNNLSKIRMQEIALLLVDIEKRVSELSVGAGARIEAIEKAA